MVIFRVYLVPDVFPTPGNHDILEDTWSILESIPSCG